MIHLQTVQSARSMVHSGYSLFTTGPHVVISIKGSIKGGPRERKEVRNKRSDGEAWSAFLLCCSRELYWIFFYFLCM